MTTPEAQELRRQQLAEIEKQRKLAAEAEVQRSHDEEVKLTQLTRLREAVAKESKLLRRVTVVGIIALGVAIWLGLSARTATQGIKQTQQEQEASRHESRLVNCANLNKLVDRDRKQAVALISAAAGSTRTTTPEEKAHSEKALRQYLEDQDFQYVNGTILAPYTDCQAYVDDPTKPHIVYLPAAPDADK
jgi:hypothetical protein